MKLNRKVYFFITF